MRRIAIIGGTPRNTRLETEREQQEQQGGKATAKRREKQRRKAGKAKTKPGAVRSFAVAVPALLPLQFPLFSRLPQQ
jgi:hypothetical protein